MRVRIVFRKPRQRRPPPTPRSPLSPAARRRRWLAALSIVAAGGLAYGAVYLALISRPRFGTLSIKTDPPGAEVFIDNQKSGVTPIEALQITSGPHRIRLSLEGYFDLEREVQVRSNLETRSKEVLEPVIRVQLSPDDHRRINEWMRRVQLTLNEKIHFPPPDDFNTLYFCQQILALDPVNDFARRTLRRLAEQLREQLLLATRRGDSEEAEKILADLTRLDPNDTETADKLAELRQQMEQKREQHRKRLETLTARIDAAFAADRLIPPAGDNVLDLLRELAQVDPRSRYLRGARTKLRETLRDRSLEKITKQDWSGARVTLTAALQVAPDDREISDRLVEVNKKLDEIAQAELDKQRRAEQERQRVVRGQELRRNGIAAFRSGNFEKALEELRGAADIQGIDDELSFYLGSTYLELKQPERALTAFRDCITANPGHAPAHVQLGLLYLNVRRDYARAVDHFERAAAIGGAPGYDRARLAQLVSDARYQALLVKAGDHPIQAEHDHAFGGCRGELRLSGAGIEFRTGNKDHAFIRPFNSVRSVNYRNDGIELRFSDNKKYTFRFRNREDLQIVRELLRK